MSEAQLLAEILDNAMTLRLSLDGGLQNKADVIINMCNDIARRKELESEIADRLRLLGHENV